MSATNRGADRAPNDFYPTPQWLTRAFLPHLDSPLARTSARPSHPNILEPACGTGAITECLREWRPLATIDECDIAAPQPIDFLTTDFGNLRWDLIITNPPYFAAMEFVQKSLALAPLVAMLLRVNFLGSSKRAPWLRAHTPAIYVTPRRPPFSLNKHGKPGTDATEYAWFVWGIQPNITILETEKK